MTTGRVTLAGAGFQTKGLSDGLCWLVVAGVRWLVPGAVGGG